MVKYQYQEIRVFFLDLWKNYRKHILCIFFDNCIFFQDLSPDLVCIGIPTFGKVKLNLMLPLEYLLYFSRNNIYITSNSSFLCFLIVFHYTSSDSHVVYGSFLSSKYTLRIYLYCQDRTLLSVKICSFSLYRCTQFHWN